MTTPTERYQKSIYADPKTAPPLDESLYSLIGEELEFYQSETKIKDEQALKGHILAVQAKAYAIYGFPCIRRFAFLTMKIARLPAYKHALKLGREREGAILLDIGCCFGNDIRKAVVDGWPVENVIASDLKQGFWDCGHALFRSTPETFPAAFVEGDAFDSAFIQPRAPFYEQPISERPDLHSLKSLTPLQGHLSAIHASSFFHLFSEERQLELAHRVASLLSPLPGSIIFGSHGGLPKKGVRIEGSNSSGVPMFCHDPDSWRELWDGQVFKKGSVKVEAGLRLIERNDSKAPPDAEFYFMWWSVTRL